MRNKLEFYECWARTVYDMNFPMFMPDSDQQDLKIKVEYPNNAYNDYNVGDKLWIICPFIFN